MDLSWGKLRGGDDIDDNDGGDDDDNLTLYIQNLNQVHWVQKYKRD